MTPLQLPIPLECPHLGKPDAPHERGICSDCQEILTKWFLENAWGYCMTCAVRRGPVVPFRQQLAMGTYIQEDEPEEVD